MPYPEYGPDYGPHYGDFNKPPPKPVVITPEP